MSPSEFSDTFETDVMGSNQQRLGRLKFVTDKNPKNIKLKIPTSFPNLSVSDLQSCKNYHTSVAQWISHMSMTDYFYTYTTDLEDVTVLKTLRPKIMPPLKFTLHRLTVERNYAKGTLDPVAIFVKINDPENNIIVNIKDKLTHIWKKTPLKILKKESDTQKETIICKYENKIVESTGDIITYDDSILDHIDDLQKQPSQYRYVSYQPGVKIYKDAVFQMLFPIKSSLPQEEEWIECDEVIKKTDEWEEDFSDTSSVTTQKISRFEEKTVLPNFIHYKLEENHTEIESPFVYLDKDSKAYLTRAFQVTCFPMNSKGEVDQNTPFLYQYLLRTDIYTGAHSLKSPGFGLRWPVYDQKEKLYAPSNTVIESDDFQDSILSVDLKTLRQDKNGNRTAGYNSEVYTLTSEKALEDLKNLTDDNEKNYTISGDIKGLNFILTRTKLELYLKNDNLQESPESVKLFSQTIFNLKNLISVYFRVEGDYKTSIPLLFQCGLPSNLTDFAIRMHGDLTDFMKNIFLKTELAHLKLLNVHSTLKTSSYAIYGQLAACIHKFKTLETLYINYTHDNHPSCQISGTYGGIGGLAVPQGHYPSQYTFETQDPEEDYYRHVSSNLYHLNQLKWAVNPDPQYIFKNTPPPSLKRLVFHKQHTIPKGCTIYYSIEKGTYRFCPDPIAREWTWLMKALQSKRSGLTIEMR